MQRFHTRARHAFLTLPQSCMSLLVTGHFCTETGGEGGGGGGGSEDGAQRLHYETCLFFLVKEQIQAHKTFKASEIMTLARARTHTHTHTHTHTQSRRRLMKKNEKKHLEIGFTLSPQFFFLPLPVEAIRDRNTERGRFPSFSSYFVANKPIDLSSNNSLFCYHSSVSVGKVKLREALFPIDSL